jgi:alcohol dehydrogenase class IV
MTLATWAFPTRILFGSGSAEHTGAELARLDAKRALIVTDRGVRAAGLLEAVEASLSAAGVSSAVFDGVAGNPVEKNVHDGLEAYRGADAQAVVAVGGGSSLDVAKLVALVVNHRRPLTEYDDGIGGDEHITGAVPPIVALPTTAGTGSEVGRSAVVTLDANARKTVIFSPKLLPRVALLDPMLTRSMPPQVTAATGYDALTHAVEAFVSRGDHPMCDAIALGAIDLCQRSLLRVYSHGDDLAARGDMLKAAMMGAVAFQKGLGACHSLAHPLSSIAGLHHGLANALCLPAVVRFNLDGADATLRQRYATIASRLSGSAAESTAAPASCAERLAELREALELPAGLLAAGVAEQQLEALADAAVEDACHQLNPKRCDRAAMLAMYRDSM